MEHIVTLAMGSMEDLSKDHCPQKYTYIQNLQYLQITFKLRYICSHSQSDEESSYGVNERARTPSRSNERRARPERP